MNQASQSASEITSAVRKQLIELLTGSNAHKSFAESVANLPTELRGVKPDKLPYTIWQLVEHIRIVQHDILEFSRNPDYQSPSWPAGYWPKELAPSNEAAWQQALNQVQQDREEFIALFTDPQADLYTPFAHGDGQNLLREAMLIADHTAYHVGEILVIRRLLGAWKS